MPATPGNALDITAAGLVKFDGTATFSGVTVTQHDVLVGGSANAITSVAPSATSGVPLISQGASSDPAFGTAVVAGGGTGITSGTAYGVVCAGTTSTGAFQVVSPGTSGYVLQSGGASALPTWVANSSTGNLVLIQSQSTSSGASVSFTTGITSTYSTYLFIFSSVSTATGSDTVQMTLSSNGGSSYASSSYQGGNFYIIYSGGGITNANSTSNIPVNTGNGTTQATSINGILWCNNIAQSSQNAFFHGELALSNGSAYYEFTTGTQTTLTAVNAFKFAGSAGNFNGGTISLFGVLE